MSMDDNTAVVILALIVMVYFVFKAWIRSRRQD